MNDYYCGRNFLESSRRSTAPALEKTWGASPRDPRGSSYGGSRFPFGRIVPVFHKASAIHAVKARGNSFEINFPLLGFSASFGENVQDRASPHACEAERPWFPHNFTGGRAKPSERVRHSSVGNVERCGRLGPVHFREKARNTNS